MLSDVFNFMTMLSEKKLYKLIHTRYGDNLVFGFHIVQLHTVAPHYILLRLGKFNQCSIIISRAVARTLMGGGGVCLFIYSCSARLVRLQIDKIEFDFKRN